MDFKLVAFCDFKHGSFHGDRAAARDAFVILVPVVCQRISIKLEKLKRLT